MSALDAIKEAIEKLPPEDQSDLTSWLVHRTMDDWDRKMALDFAPGGRGMRLVEEAKNEIATGKVEDLVEGLVRRQHELP